MRSASICVLPDPAPASPGMFVSSSSRMRRRDSRSSARESGADATVRLLDSESSLFDLPDPPAPPGPPALPDPPDPEDPPSPLDAPAQPVPPALPDPSAPPDPPGLPAPRDPPDLPDLSATPDPRGLALDMRGEPPIRRQPGILQFG